MWVDKQAPCQPDPVQPPSCRSSSRAPHQLTFLAGMVVLVIGSLWWWSVQAAWVAAPPRMPPGQVHGLLMTFGFMPLFFMGFLFTAGPKWLRVAPLPASALLPAIGLQLVGWGGHLAVAYVDLGRFALVASAAALATAALGWTMAWRDFARMLRRSAQRDKLHLTCVLWAGLLGVAALWTCSVAVLLDLHGVVDGAIKAALFGFDGLTVAAVSHRMVPFYASAAWSRLDERWPNWLLWFQILALVVCGVAATLERSLLSMAPAAAKLAAGLEAALGIFLLGVATRWGWVQNVSIRFMAMLHTGFLWLGLSCLLAGLGHLLSTITGGQITLGRAPLHALAMGYMGTTMLAMVTRVVCGQRGTAVVADRFLWSLFWLLQVAILLRLTSQAVWLHAAPWRATLLAAAAAAWAAAWSVWAARYGKWLVVNRRRT